MIRPNHRCLKCNSHHSHVRERRYVWAHFFRHSTAGTTDRDRSGSRHESQEPRPSVRGAYGGQQALSHRPARQDSKPETPNLKACAYVMESSVGPPDNSFVEFLYLHRAEAFQERLASVGEVHEYFS